MSHRWSVRVDPKVVSLLREVQDSSQRYWTMGELLEQAVQLWYERLDEPESTNLADD